MQEPIDWRHANARQIASGLHAVRSRTLAIFDDYARAGALTVPLDEAFNPPLWELGHVGWYQEFWIGRNQQRERGVDCEPVHARAASLVAQSDAWYDSSTVPHASRWALPLLGAADCKSYLFATLEQTLGLLARAGSSDAALYFFRWVLFHEAMHLEAAVYMAQALGLALPSCADWLEGGETRAVVGETRAVVGETRLSGGNATASATLALPSQAWSLGSSTEGFAFDNELGAHTVQLPACDIDAAPVSWDAYLRYALRTGCALPRYVRATEHLRAASPLRTTDNLHAESPASSDHVEISIANCFEQQVLGRWQPVQPLQSAVHISHSEALAYCQHVGRALPTEAQWECAAMTRQDFQWGQVWEWTASTFAPYPGFKAHPYRDYSEPWFHSRPVLRGACTATQNVVRNAKYRNYFLPERTDIYAGFRTCSA